MKKNILKTLLFILIIITLFSLTCNSFASGYIRDVSPTLPSGGEQVTSITNNVIGIMMWIGYACAIGMIVFIGIKYIIASADEKASLKGMLVKVVIGSLIIVLSLQITNAVINIMSDGKGTSSSSTSTGGSAALYEDVLE